MKAIESKKRIDFRILPMEEDDFNQCVETLKRDNKVYQDDNGLHVTVAGADRCAENNAVLKKAVKEGAKIVLETGAKTMIEKTLTGQN